MKETFGLSHRDIVVTIPKAKLAEIEAEEDDVSRMLAGGNDLVGFYWQLGRLPKEMPRRIYFVWNGAVRAFHDVTGMEDGKIYMRPQINDIEPIPMESFRGFRYFKGSVT